MRTMPAARPAATSTELTAIERIVTMRGRRGRGGSGAATDVGGEGHSGDGAPAEPPRSDGEPPGNIASVVSTFLVTLTIVVLAIGGATAVAIKDPDQPATLRTRRRRARPPARQPKVAARAPVPQPAAPRMMTVPATHEAGMGF